MLDKEPFYDPRKILPAPDENDRRPGSTFVMGSRREGVLHELRVRGLTPDSLCGTIKVLPKH